MADTITTELKIINERGLHARAAANFVKTIENFDAEVEVERLGQTVDGTSIMGLMMLAASLGTTIKITATGSQKEEALKALTELINNKFGEER